jgi:hypothetical protein
MFMSLQDNTQRKRFKKGVPKQEKSRNSSEHTTNPAAWTSIVTLQERYAKKIEIRGGGGKKVREGAVVGVAESGDHGTG